MAVDVARLHVSRDVRTIKTIRERGVCAVRREQLGSLAVSALTALLIVAITVLAVVGREVPSELSTSLTLLIGYFVGQALSTNSAPSATRRKVGGDG